MQDSITVESAAGGEALALAAIHEQQEKLKRVLEETRAVSAVHLAGQQKAREESAVVAKRIVEMEMELSRSRSSELALDIVALREEQRALQQQEARLTDKIAEMTGLCRRLRLAIQESENLRAVLVEKGPIQEDGTSAVFWRVAQAQEEERRRLAREIHDGPAQALANAVFELEFCDRLLEKDPAKLRKELHRLKDDLRQSLADVRHYIFGLRLSVLSELGLSATLRRYAEDYQARCGITVNLELVEGLRLSSTQEVAIFRIVQEALQNTRKHSRAPEVLLRVSAVDQELVVMIEDNGEGFDMEQAARRRIDHFGLRGMEERTRLIGARLEVSSRPGAGTRVVLTVPREVCEECS